MSADSVAVADREPDTLSIPEAAVRLGVSRWTLRDQVNATGEVLPGVRVFKIGGRDRVSRIQVDEFLRTGRVSVETPA